MQRGEIYLIHKPGNTDPKKRRPVVIVSRNELILSRFSTLICAPIFSSYNNLETQVEVDEQEGLKHLSSIHCDELYSFPRDWFTQYLGQLNPTKLDQLSRALAIALDIKFDFLNN